MGLRTMRDQVRSRLPACSACGLRWGIDSLKRSTTSSQARQPMKAWASMVERQPSQPTSKLPLMGARKASTPRPVSALDMTCAPICGA